MLCGGYAAVRYLLLYFIVSCLLTHTSLIDNKGNSRVDVSAQTKVSMLATQPQPHMVCNTTTYL